jgi:hypothetical protein
MEDIMANPVIGSSMLTRFEFHNQNARNQLFANGLQRVSMHIQIRKNVWSGNSWDREDLSAQELSTLRLIRADGQPMGAWTNFFDRGRTDIILGENINSQASFPEQTTGDVAVPEEAVITPFPEGDQLITRYLSSNTVATVLFIAEVRLDGESQPTRMSTNNAVVCEAMLPRNIMERDLVRETVQKFDESVFWDKIFWWSLYVTYFRFPPGSPIMLAESVILEGGREISGRPNLRNIFSNGHRHADVMVNGRQNNISTAEIRRSFSSHSENNPQYVSLRSGLNSQWPIRVLVFYENPNSHPFRSFPVRCRFLDHFGTSHVYTVQVEMNGTINIVDNHPRPN